MFFFARTARNKARLPQDSNIFIIFFWRRKINSQNGVKYWNFMDLLILIFFDSLGFLRFLGFFGFFFWLFGIYWNSFGFWIFLGTLRIFGIFFVEFLSYWPFLNFIWMLMIFGTLWIWDYLNFWNSGISGIFLTFLGF